MAGENITENKFSTIQGKKKQIFCNQKIWKVRSSVVENYADI